MLLHTQYDFRSGRSCELQILKVVNHWTGCIDAGDEVNFLFLYLQKAFNKVSNRCLIFKLRMCLWYTSVCNILIKLITHLNMLALYDNDSYGNWHEQVCFINF